MTTCVVYVSDGTCCKCAAGGGVDNIVHLTEEPGTKIRLSLSVTQRQESKLIDRAVHMWRSLSEVYIWRTLSSSNETPGSVLQSLCTSTDGNGQVMHADSRE